MRAYHADSLRNVGGLITSLCNTASRMVGNQGPCGLGIHTLTMRVHRLTFAMWLLALSLSLSPPPLLSSCRELIYMHDNNVSTPIQGNF